MKRNTKPEKNKILSKRVLIAFGIILFLFIGGILFRVSSIEREIVIQLENEESEELFEDEESEGNPNFPGGIDLWIWVLSGAILAKLITKMYR